MRTYCLSLLWLLSGTLCLLQIDPPAARANESGPSEPDCPAVLKRIVADWQSQEVPRSQRIEWRINSHARSVTFSDEVPARDISVVVLYDDHHVRLEAYSFPPDEVFQFNPFRPAGRRMTGDVKLEEFKTALYSRFQNRLAQKVVQPYLLVRESDRELHLWSEVADSGRYAAICRPGEAARSFQEPLVSWLVEGLTLSRCISVTDELVNIPDWRLLPDHVSLHGHDCVVLECQYGGPEVDALLNLWIDLLASRVRRSIVRSSDGSPRRQYDFQYRDSSADRIPATVSIILFASTSAVHDSLSLSLVASESSVDVNLRRQNVITPATLVTDCIAARRYFIEKDNSERELTDNDLLAWSSYERIQREEQNANIDAKTQQAIGGRRLLSTSIFKWPHVLQTLVVGLVAIYLLAVSGIVLRHRWSRKTVRFAVLGVLPVVAAATIVRRIDLGETDNRNAYDVLFHLVARIESIRSSPATPDDWQAFQSDVLAVLDPMIAGLSNQSSRFPVQQSKWLAFEVVNAKARQELLQAANGLKAEVEGGIRRRERQVSYLHHLSRAGEILQGGSLVGVQKQAPIAIDPFIVEMIGANVLLLAAGAIYWQQRKKRALPDERGSTD
jgi:hypothetical protein